MLKKLLNDENGFVVSAELILVSTITVLGLVVGLAEVRQAVAEELEDVASAIGSINQGFCLSGMQTCDKAHVKGSFFYDDGDFCDSQYDIVGTHPAFEGE
jgi:hypothetical protein